ncbi:hypothetical protein ABTM63_19910, partial [Acinetobacter baumannii]
MRQVQTGTLPSGVVFDGPRNRVVVACANSDRVIELDPTSGVKAELPLKLERGSAPTGLALKGDELLVTLAGVNSVV